MLIILVGLLQIYGKSIRKEQIWCEKQQIMKSQNNSKGFTITIPGSGTVDLLPSIGTVSFTIEILDKDASEALDQANNLVMNAVQQIKNELGYSNYEIETGMFELEIQYKDNEQQLQGYKVRNQLYVITRDLQMIGKIITIGVNAGLNIIDGITYQNKAEEIDQANDEALNQAIEDAKRKAKQVADSLKMKVLRIKKFKYLDSYGSSITNGYQPETRVDENVRKNEETPIFASKSHVRVDIQLKVELEY
ncbi:unnamed protein product [Paramecium sonneborni]|uniref:SIMPL domain-containing protein n=1 Tax=Paramecium sonneborni TaxID=65129 RepID=A0A8S1LGR2_9CILI|nr:unnamed protein product [Paramecium sonneborni]